MYIVQSFNLYENFFKLAQYNVIKKRNELICMKMLLDIELAKEMTILSGFHINIKCVFLICWPLFSKFSFKKVLANVFTILCHVKQLMF